LRLARQELGLSVAEVAKSIGVSSVAVYYWEHGQARPRERNLEALCRVLKLPADEATTLTGR
jgi:transcriptional regulator with XRE-family HTH domain